VLPISDIFILLLSGASPCLTRWRRSFPRKRAKQWRASALRFTKHSIGSNMQAICLVENLLIFFAMLRPKFFSSPISLQVVTQMQASNDPAALYASLPPFRRKVVDEWEQKERNIRSAVMESTMKDRKDFERRSRAYKTYKVRELGGSFEMMFTVWGEAAAGCFDEGCAVRIFNASPVNSGISATDNTWVAPIHTTSSESTSLETTTGRRLTTLIEAACLEGPQEVDLVVTMLHATKHPITAAPVLFLADPSLKLLRIDALVDALSSSLPFNAAPGDTLALANLKISQPTSEGVVYAEWTNLVFASASPKGMLSHGADLRHLAAALTATQAWATSRLGEASLHLASQQASKLPLDQPKQLLRVGRATIQEAHMRHARVLHVSPMRASSSSPHAIKILLENGLHVVEAHLSALLLLAVLRLARDFLGSHTELNDLALVLLVSAATESPAAAGDISMKECMQKLAYIVGAAPLDFSLARRDPSAGESYGAKCFLEVLSVQRAA